MAHLVQYSENMEEKTAQFYLETQTEKCFCNEILMLVM